MKYLTWIVAFLIVGIVNNTIKELDIAYTLAVLICPDDITNMARLAGLFSGIFAATTYGCAFYFARKINKRRETAKKQESTNAVDTIHTEEPVVPAAESVVEPKPEPISSKQRYCKYCGGAIDNQTKKCEKCHKQYFRITRTGVIVCCMCVLILALVTGIAYQHNRYEQDVAMLNAQIAELEEKYDSTHLKLFDRIKESVALKREIESLENQIAEYEWQVNFYNDHVVFVSDDGTNKYHNLTCGDLDLSYFWAYNVEFAELKGYSPCSKCCK